MRRCATFARVNQEEQKVTTQLLIFFPIFASIIVAFGFFIAFVARRLNHNISQRLFSMIEYILIGGILLGVVGLFQGWSLAGYGIGFHVLLVSVLGYVVWSHVTPRTRKTDTQN